MRRKDIKKFLCGLTICFVSIPLLTVDSLCSENEQCVAKEEILKVVEAIPKKFPLADKDNVYIIDSNANGRLTATIEGLSLTFFDSRDSEKSNWGVISNGYEVHGINTSLETVGCVTAGINNYESGKVDDSQDAVQAAQTTYNDLVKTTERLLNK